MRDIVLLVGSTIEIYYDVRSYKRQILLKHFIGHSCLYISSVLTTLSVSRVICGVK
jgi:hypothetical protein